MEYRSLGRSGVKVSPVCLGTMMFGGQTDEADAIRIIHRAHDLGVNFIDTANRYNGGESERVVGKAIADRRDGIVLVAAAVIAITRARYAVERCSFSSAPLQSSSGSYQRQDDEQ